MEWACSTHKTAEKYVHAKFQFEKSERKRTLGKSKHRWKYDIKNLPS